MKYWMDTEFIEAGPKYPVELLSIGIVAEDGRELYYQVANANYAQISDWVQENVVQKFLPCPNRPHVPILRPGETLYTEALDAKEAHCIAGRCQNNCPWDLRTQIAHSIREFVNPHLYGKPEFWGWFCDYDWVVFCQLFGSMMGLPDYFPRFCMDAKQLCVHLGNPRIPVQKDATGDHNALVDARWTRDVYNWLTNYALSQIVLAHVARTHPAVQSVMKAQRENA